MAELVSVSPRPAAQSNRKLFWRAASFGGRLLALIILVVAAVAFLFPLVWMLSTALKDESEVFAIPLVWIPAQLRFSNFPESLTYFPFPLYLRNTLIITIPSILGNLASSAVVAYG